MSKHKETLQDRQEWMRRRRGETPPGDPKLSSHVTEPHYTPKDLGDRWGFSSCTIQSLFRDEPGVLKTGTVRTKLRIPQSVAERVHARLSA